MNADVIAAAIERKREIHPELSRPMTWTGLVRICERESVRIAFQPLTRAAQLAPFLGDWCILINKELPFRRHTYYGVHELGHLWLHHDRTNERTDRVYNMGYDWNSDPREDDAEVFASLLLMGPKRSGPWVQPVPFVLPDQPPAWETPTQRAIRLGKLHTQAGAFRRGSHG